MMKVSTKKRYTGKKLLKLANEEFNELPYISASNENLANNYLNLKDRIIDRSKLLNSRSMERYEANELAGKCIDKVDAINEGADLLKSKKDKDSIYQKIFGKYYNTLHDIAYKSEINLGGSKINASSILNKLYRRSPVAMSLLPAPRMHLFHEDKVKTRKRRLKTVIDNNPYLNPEEKILEYYGLREGVMNRLHNKKIKVNFNDRWDYNKLIESCDTNFKRIMKKVMPEELERALS